MLEALRLRVLAVARARVAIGRWTVSGLARKAGISQPQLHHALSGERQLSIYLTDQLAQALGLDLAAMPTMPAEPHAMTIPNLFHGRTARDSPAGPETPASKPAAGPKAPLASFTAR